jgi:hypothetical protein
MGVRFSNQMAGNVSAGVPWGSRWGYQPVDGLRQLGSARGWRGVAPRQEQGLQKIRPPQEVAER